MIIVIAIDIVISIVIVENFSLADTKWLRRIMKKVAMVEEVVEEEKVMEFTELEVVVKERKVAD